MVRSFSCARGFVLPSAILAVAALANVPGTVTATAAGGACELPGACGAAPEISEGNDAPPLALAELEDSQSLLQAFVRGRRDLELHNQQQEEHQEQEQQQEQEQEQEPDAGYGVPECAMTPGTIVTLTGGRSGKFCSDLGNKVVCDKDEAGKLERFEVVDAGDGRVGLRGGKSRQMCADTGSATECNRPWIKKWEWFYAKSLPGKKVQLQGARALTFCTDDPAGVRCTKKEVSDAEKFGLACVDKVPDDGFTLLYALNECDTILVKTRGTTATTAVTISFCTSESCSEMPMTFNLRYTDSTVTRNSLLGGARGTEERGGLDPATAKAGDPTAIRFSWFPDAWQITVNDVRVPGLDFKHRTKKEVSYIRVASVGGATKTTFSIIKCPATTTKQPVTVATTTEITTTTTTTRATTTRTTTTRATTTTTTTTTTTRTTTTTTGWPDMCRLVTCTLAVDDSVTGVTYNNADLTGSVQGARADWQALKTFHFNYVEGAYLTVGGRNFQTDGCNQAAGFKLSCDGLSFKGKLEAVNVGTPWAAGDPRLVGRGDGWAGNLPVTKFKDTWLPKFADPPVWPGTCLPYALFRVRTEAAEPLAEPELGTQRGSCSWFGDPHFTTFDGLRQDELRSGKFWIVRHAYVQIQGLFCGTYDRATRECNGGQPATTQALAVGGPFLGGNTLIIETSNGRVYWGKRAVDKVNGAADFDFVASDGTVTVKLSQRAGVLTVDLPLGIKLRVVRGWKWKNQLYANVVLSMRGLQGQDGTCGNFDGKRSNDKYKGRDYRVKPCNDLFVFGSPEGPQGRALVLNETDFDPEKPLCSEEQLQQARDMCGARMPAGTAKAIVDDCVYDVCAFGDESMAVAAAEHERLARAVGWREINPPELNREYSSVWDNNAAGTGHSRSMLDSPQAWSAAKNVAGEWLQLDLETVHDVEGVVVQGRADADQWVTLYSVQYSLDGIVFDSVPGGPFEGARDRNTRARVLFAQPVRARFVRVVALEWSGHISMRVGLLGCHGQPEKCIDYVKAPIETNREYSSTWSNAAPGTTYVQSLLDSPTSWVAAQNVVGEWMQLDLGVAHDVDGVVVQGRADADQRVTKFGVQYSLDGIAFEAVPGTFTRRFTSRHTKFRALFPQMVRARFVRLVVQEWVGHICMRAGVLACNPEPQKCPRRPVSELSRDYSSTWNNNARGTGYAVSGLDSSTGWVAAKNVVGEWMQLDLDVPHDVAGVIMQGRADADQRVTKFTVQYSTDGVNFVPVPGTFARPIASRYTKATALFPESVRARFVRIVVQEWFGHISMRAAVLACNPEPSRCPKEERNPDDITRDFSSVWDNNPPGVGHARSGLDSPQAWSAARNVVGEWMQMDLGLVHDVNGVVVQGRADMDQRVTKFSVQHSIDGVTWVPVDGVFNHPFTNNFLRSRTLFPRSVKARFVRIVVVEWFGHISMRAGILACNCQTGRCPDYERAVPESSREYSSTWDNHVPGMNWAKSALDSPTGWVAKQNVPGEWLQFDLDMVHDVDGVVVQGRADANQRVTKYRVQYSIDGVTFETVPVTYERPHTNRFTKVRSLFPQTVQARFVRIVVVEWFGHITMRATVLACNPRPFKCANYQRNPDELIRDYSSIFGNNAPGTGFARSALDSPAGWVAAKNVAGEWMQIDVESVSDIEGVVLQGRADADNRVTKFTVQHSLDGNTFQNVPGTYFRLAFSPHTKVRAMFPQPVRARFVRIVVQDWVGNIAMRAGALVCNSQPDKCANYLRNPAEVRREYSSIWANAEVGTGLARSKLDSPASWSAARNVAGEWMQMDLSLVFDVDGVVVQGRADFDQRVTKFTVQHSLDNSNFEPVPGVFERTLTNRFSKMTALFPKTVRARFIRITVLEWFGHISMRAGVLGCNGVYVPPKACKMTTCAVAFDDEVTSVFYRNMDITGVVAGNKADWQALKTFHFNYAEGAYLAVAGRNFQTDGCNQAAGFKLQCFGVDASAGKLEALNSATAWAAGSPALLGQGDGWTGGLQPTRFAATWLPGFAGAPVWPGTCLQHAAFRLRTDAFTDYALNPPQPPTGNLGSCSISGDPHFKSFDGATVDELRSGKYWIVRHSLLQVQGLFCGTFNKVGPVCNAGLPATTRSLAIGGAALLGHILIIETSEGRVFWDKTPIDKAGTADFDFSFTQGAMTVKLTQRTNGFLTVNLPLGANVYIQRALVWGGGVYMNVNVDMKRLPGQDGYCGNFDGVNNNDFFGQDFRVPSCQDLFVLGSADEAEIQVKVKEETDFKEQKPCEQAKLEQALKDCAAKMPPGASAKSIEECAFDVCSLEDTALADNDAEEERLAEELAASI